MSKINIAKIIIPLRVPLIVHSNTSPIQPNSSTGWSVKTATKQATYIPSEIRYGLGFDNGSSLDCELAMPEWNKLIALDNHNHNWVSSWTRLVSIQLPVKSGYNFIVTHSKYLVGYTKDGENVLFIYAGMWRDYYQVVFNKITNEIIKCDCGIISNPCIHMRSAADIITAFDLKVVLKS